MNFDLSSVLQNRDVHKNIQYYHTSPIASEHRERDWNNKKVQNVQTAQAEM